MAKFGSPLKGKLYITQTYHGTSNKAIDFSAIADIPVYALADGKIIFRSSKAGSYCTQSVSGSILKVYYVHTYKWKALNSIVKKGQIIGYIAPKSVNGGYPTHLHLGLQYPYGLMDFFDRTIQFATRYTDIKKSWFKIDGTINWRLFKDLDYKTLKPVLVVKPLETLETKIPTESNNIPVSEIEGLKMALGSAEGVIKSKDDSIRLLSERNSYLEASMKETNSQFTGLENMLSDLRDKYDKLTREHTETVSELNELKSGSGLVAMLSKLFNKK